MTTSCVTGDPKVPERFIELDWYYQNRCYTRLHCCIKISRNSTAFMPGASSAMDEMVSLQC